MKWLISSTVSFTIITLLGSTFVRADNSPLSVGISNLSNLLISPKNSAPAFVISLNHTTISSEITGQALKILAETGDYIKEGDKLASIDCRSYLLAKKLAEAGLKVAKTQLNFSEKQFKRNQRLLKTGIIPKENFEKAEASRLTALADILLKKASIDSTKLAISRCQIYAPFSGQITKKLVQKGQLVTSGTPLFKIMENGRIEVKADLSFNSVQKLDDSSSLVFVSGDKHYKVIVRSIIQNIDEATRTQEVRFALEKKSAISTGLSGRIEWSGTQRLLPAEYLIRRNSILGIILVEDIVEGIGIAIFHQIIGAEEGLPAKVSLPKNTVVITQNRYNVKNGQSVKVR